ncbi:MAG: NapC/NirT family cytochrome c [Chloroflexi bacterium]|nr:NapC/NirT family cytochrome c [Chloroflexota bacterium]
MLTSISLFPSGFSAGVAAAVAAGIAVILLLPFGIVLFKLLKRTVGFSWINRKLAAWTIGAFLFLVMISWATSNPYFCGSCHAMKPAVATWAQGPHKNLSCLSCHREKGLGGITIRKLEDVRMLGSAAFAQEPRGLNKPIRDVICLGCHGDIKTQARVTRKVKVSHREFVNRGITCIDCHPDASHGKQDRSRAFVMQKCSTCHNGKQASAGCSTCHLQMALLASIPAASSGIAHGPGWLQVHGMKSQGICAACHTDQDCEKCHTAMPHPDGWSLEHGQRSAGNQKACMTCHINGQSCDNCHQLSLPHPAGWLNSHAANARQRGSDLCDNCHLEKDCTSCHEKHKNLPQVKKVKAHGK